MSDPGKAVFLSYASQDVEAAKRIADALRAAGVEVWFDQSELRGGDAWDAKLRRQIKECALFVPIITPNTNARAEGYFRLEWKLAVDRSHLMADDAHFLFPIVVGDVADATARVPDKFRDVQWTRLRLDETPAELGTRVAKLLSGGAPEDRGQRSADRGGRSPSKAQPTWLRYAWAGVGIVFAVIYAVRPLWQSARHPEPKPAAVAPATPPAPQSEARQLIARARAMSLDKYDSTVEDFASAESLIKKALELDPNDAEIWAFSSLLNFSFGSRGFDHAPSRVAAARSQAERALSLNPDSLEGLFALARWQRDNEDPAVAEASFKKILAREPNHVGALSGLAWIYDQTDRVDESAAFYERVAALPDGNAALARYTEFLLFFHRARFEEADRCIRQSIASQPSANSLAGLANLLLTWKGDVDGAARVLASMPTTARSLPRTIWTTALVQLCQRAPADALSTLDRFSDDYIQDNFFAGPKSYWTGRAHALAGRKEAARLAWEAGLDVVNARLKNAAQNRELHLMRGELLALLGQIDEAVREAHTVAELARGAGERYWFWSPVVIYAALGRADDALPLLEKLRTAGPVETIVGWPLTPALLRLDPLWDKLRDDPRFQALLKESTAAAAPPAGAAKVDDKSVTVLAFANLSDDKANEYFSDGISEELLNVLAKIPGLKVSARTSAFYFKGKQVPMAEIAQQLGVAYVVEGSVRKQGDKVRITAQLIKAADGFHVWSDTFTRDLKDIFAVQDEIAGLIAKNLEVKMGMTAARPTIDVEAYQEYLAGRALFAKASNGDLRAAVGHFEKAVAIEPKFTAAWVQLASAHTRLGRWGGTPTLQAWQAARAAIDRARAQEPDSPEVLLALGWILRTADWDWRDAERAFRRALGLQPNQPDVLAGAAVLLFNVGKTDEAFRLGRRAVQLDPLNAGTQIDLSIMFYLNGNPVEAEQAARRALQLAPGGASYHAILAWSLIAQGRFAEAETEIALDPDVVEQPTARGLLAIARGEGAEARRMIAQLEDLARVQPDAADLQQSIAWIAAMLGDKEKAFASLDKARASRDPSMSWLRNSKYLQPLESDPRWPALVREVGLADDQLK